MAGIAFKLQKVLKKNDLTSLAKVYSYGAVLSAGGWVISILAILFVGIINIYLYNNQKDINIFQVSVTYLISLSLIVSSVHHLTFTRFVADCIFEKEFQKIIPNFFGVFIVNNIISFIFIVFFEYCFLKNTDGMFLIVFLFSFLVLSNIWILNILASSINEFKYVTWSYFVSYLFIVFLSFFLGKYGKIFLLFSFYIGNVVLFFLLMFLVLKKYNFKKILSFEFLKAYKKYWELVLIGFFFNLAIWSDEYVFWFSKNVSYAVIDHIRASIIYDLPLSLAYVSIIPGMAIFFIRLEVDFAILYEKYFDGVINGATLGYLIFYKNKMIDILRLSVKESIILQGIFNLFLFIFSKEIFEFFNLPLSSLPLFYIDLIATQLQLLAMNLLAFLYYFDRRKESLIVVLVMFLLNLFGSMLSIKLGPYFYGYGTAIAMLVASILAIIYLRNTLKRLEYETFMLQK